MPPPETQIDLAPLTCSVCGRSSIWRKAFIEMGDDTGKRVCCPRCLTAHRARERRSELVWIAVFAAVAFVYLTEGRGHGPDLLIVGMLLFTIVQFPLTLLHECGHALVSRLVGVPAYLVIVGREPWIFDRQVLGLRLRIGWLPAGGATYHAPCEGRYARARDILITAAGPLINLLIATVGFATAAGMTGRLEHSFTRLVVFVVAAASTVQFVWNVWPHDVHAAEGNMPNDGARILGLLRGKRETPSGASGARHYFRALFAFADRQFQTAAREAAKARVRFTEPACVTAVTVLGAAALSESDDARGAIEILRPLQEGHVEDAGLRSGVLDNLGWAYLLLDEPDLLEHALQFVEAACDIAPWEDSYVISLACVYAATATPENGRAAESRKFLATLNLSKLKRQNAAYAALAQGLCAIAEGNAAAARKNLDGAKSLGATAAPLRLLERRLASG